jgi:hypothetical protein
MRKAIHGVFGSDHSPLTPLVDVLFCYLTLPTSMQTHRVQLELLLSKRQQQDLDEYVAQLTKFCIAQTCLCARVCCQREVAWCSIFAAEYDRAQIERWREDRNKLRFLVLSDVLARCVVVEVVCYDLSIPTFYHR